MHSFIIVIMNILMPFLLVFWYFCSAQNTFKELFPQHKAIVAAGFCTFTGRHLFCNLAMSELYKEHMFTYVKDVKPDFLLTASAKKSHLMSCLCEDPEVGMLLTKS